VPDPVSGIEFRGEYRFDAAPAVVWASMEQTDSFEHWWAWLGEFHLVGPGLQTGSVLVGVVSPPVPYRMRVRVVLDHCVKPESIDATVHGDLRGWARLTLTPDGGECGGTIAVAAWEIEMMQRVMRLADRVAHPLLRWGHDRVVDATVAGFRSEMESHA
jgi:uncharacterized protein YndB with AHSA1/START domain